jgi:thiamine-phosphate pyrophosphorylase
VTAQASPQFRRKKPRLIVITDTTIADEGDVETRIGAVLAGAAPGSVMVQLRDHHLPDRRRLAFGERLVAACRLRGQLFVVNDRVDMAILLGADGVHLGEASVGPAEARSMLSASAWVSRACHDPSGVRLGGVDGVLLSPVMAARKGRPKLGLEGVRAARSTLSAAASSDSPFLYALGGVDAESAAACLSAGADGVAVIGAVLDGRPPRPLLEALGILED